MLSSFKYSIILLIGLITISCSSTPPEQIIDTYYLHPDFIFMGSEGDLFPVQLLQEAENAYKLGDYTNAIAALQKTPFTSGSYNHSVYLIACIALKKGDGPLAVEQFKYYIKTEDQRFIEQAKFSLILAYLANEQREEAVEQVKYILKNENDFSRSYVQKTSEIQQMMK